MKPATSLPWKSAPCSCGHPSCTAGVVQPFVVHGQGSASKGDTDYIAHAANAYPKVVDVLKSELIERRAAAADAKNNVRRAYEQSRAHFLSCLLADLGEYSE